MKMKDQEEKKVKYPFLQKLSMGHKENLDVHKGRIVEEGCKYDREQYTNAGVQQYEPRHPRIDIWHQAHGKRE